MAYRSTNPFTNIVEKSFDELSDEQLQAKVQAAQDCFDNTWRDQSFDERKTVLKRAAALMRERQQALAALATLEMGKLIGRTWWRSFRPLGGLWRVPAGNHSAVILQELDFLMSC